MSNNTSIIQRQKFLSKGTWVLIVLAGFGLTIALIRFVFGLDVTTNLNDQYPWGLWIAIDVATGVALAAGGFTTAFLVYVLNVKKFHFVVRPALLTAMLGYTFVALGLLVDLGRYYNVWHPILPSMWQGNSALFEVGMCVMTYLTVLYIEFIPIVFERYKNRVNLPGIFSRFNSFLERKIKLIDKILSKTMWFFIIMGVVLSCMHQSSLGTMMAIATTKLHPLWHTPILPLLFLLSAFSVGFPMVIVESMISSRSFKLKSETNQLADLAKYVPFLLWIYFSAKILDLINRDAYMYLLDGSLECWAFWFEMIVGVIFPIIIFTRRRLRTRDGYLFAGALMTVFGVAINRYNVFILGYKPVYAEYHYIPAWTEFAVTIGLISLLILAYRFIVLNLPVIHQLGGSKHD
ncbi:MAG: Ni/Fe-hydrogenase cytochrome b subunit [Candidatus Marinimicrobia bacterium]|nr:Ni/Fe-hydrogenase cytochrome b subunit [Candidatus Neomarinimicrobiota bacterium]MBL7108661.1 Ni/Fe-hydrogenase cytochrome b subunit [Candidatus Neomarinimicrobiota bacterium]